VGQRKSVTIRKINNRKRKRENLAKVSWTRGGKWSRKDINRNRGTIRL